MNYLSPVLCTPAVPKRVVFSMVLSSDHETPATGKTVAVTLSKAGGAFGNPSAGATNATEIANGFYFVDLSITDTNTLGTLVVRGASATCDDGGAVLIVSGATGIIAGGEGTATAATANTITLQNDIGNSSAVGGVIVITSGTGVGQVFNITSYAFSTKIVTIGGTWARTPDNTSTYAIYADSAPTVVAGTVSIVGSISGTVNASVIDFSSGANGGKDKLQKAILPLLYGCDAVSGNVWVIDPVSGNDSTGAGTWLSPLKTIYSCAIGNPAGAAVSGDVVLMLPGVQDLGTNICHFNDGVRIYGVDQKACVIVGSSAATTANACQISLGSNGRMENFTYRVGLLNDYHFPIGFYGSSQGGQNAMIENFTIIGGTDCLYVDSGKMSSRLHALNGNFITNWDYGAVDAFFSGNNTNSNVIVDDHLLIENFTATVVSSTKYALTITGGVGTFTVTVNGQTTGAQAFNVSIANLQTAIQGLGCLGAYKAFVYGTPSNYTILFPADVGNPTVSAVGSGGAVASLDTSNNQWPIVSGSITSGSHSTASGAGITENHQRNGTVRITLTNTAVNNNCTAFYASGSTATMRVEDVDVQTTFSGAGNRADIRAVSNGTVILNRCSYDPTYNLVQSGGTIIDVQTSANVTRLGNTVQTAADVGALATSTNNRALLALPNAAAGASNGLWISDNNNDRLSDAVGTVTGNVNGHVGSVSGNVGGNVLGSVESVSSPVVASNLNVTVTPIQAASTSGLPVAQDCSQFQFETKQYIFVCNDSLGNPLNLTGHDIRFNVYVDDQGTQNLNFSYDTSTSPASNIQVNLANPSNVLVTCNRSDVASPMGVNKYILWDLTGGVDVVLKRGKFEVVPAIQ